VLFPIGFTVRVDILNNFCSCILYSLNNIVLEVNVDERENYFYYEINKTDANGWEKITSPNRLNHNNVLNYADEEVKKRYFEETNEYVQRKWYKFHKKMSIEKYVLANSKLLNTVLPKILRL
jgi:hypothetical protein